MPGRRVVPANRFPQYEGRRRMQLRRFGIDRRPMLRMPLPNTVTLLRLELHHLLNERPAAQGRTLYAPAYDAPTAVRKLPPYVSPCLVSAARLSRSRTVRVAP